MLALVFGALTMGQALATQSPTALRDGTELLERLPANIDAAFSVTDAARLRQGPAGAAVQRWISELNALEGTRRGWSLLADRLDVEQGVAFDGLLGGQAVLALARREAGAPIDWLVLAAVDSAMDVRVVRRTRAVPRRIVHGRAVLGLEEESFLLSTLPPLVDGRSVLALAPAGAEWLLVRTLAVSAGRTSGLGVQWLDTMPTDAVVRGFWRPLGQGGTLWPWFWQKPEQAQPLTLWATVLDKHVEVGIGPLQRPNLLDQRSASIAEPPPLAEGVLFDLAAPSSTIVNAVLDRVGLAGLVPEGLQPGGDAGELIVRRGTGKGVELGARLAVAPHEHAGSKPDVSAPATGRVRVRPLQETRAASDIFGPRPEVAWTLLERRPDERELVLAVTAGTGQAVSPPAKNQPTESHDSPAIAIVLEAVRQAPPPSSAVRGSARPWALWQRMQAMPAQNGADTPTPGQEGQEVVSLWALFETARWHVETSPGPIRGRIILEMR